MINLSHDYAIIRSNDFASVQSVNSGHLPPPIGGIKGGKTDQTKQISSPLIYQNLLTSKAFDLYLKFLYINLWLGK